MMQLRGMMKVWEEIERFVSSFLLLCCAVCARGRLGREHVHALSLFAEGVCVRLLQLLQHNLHRVLSALLEVYNSED